MNLEKRKIEFAAITAQSWMGLLTIFNGIGILFFVANLVLLSTRFFSESTSTFKYIYLGIIVVIIAVSYFAYKYMQPHFKEKYGHIESKPVSTLRKILYFFGSILVYAVATKIDSYFVLPFSLTFLTWAIFVAYLWCFLYRGLSNVLIYLSMILLLLSFIPWRQIYSLIDQSSYQIDSEYFFKFIFIAIAGFLITIAGIVNRMILSELITPVVQDEEEIYESV